MNAIVRHYRSRTPGQAIVEFALVLPILLLLLFGIIEFGRLLHAWITVQNGARWGLRFAVTGEFDIQYCDEATAAMTAIDPDYAVADIFNGDPANDCNIPDEYGDEAVDMENALVDWARLPSTRDQSRVGSTGIAIDENGLVYGDYLEFLRTHDDGWLGDPSAQLYYHVTLCSNRDEDQDGNSDFLNDNSTYPRTCFRVADSIHMDDGGGPGDRVRVTVCYNHEVFAPILDWIYPGVPMCAHREGIVERFRTSRISGIGSQIGDLPTVTPTPGPTLPPTHTHTPAPPTLTPTRTGTSTQTSTTTPTSTPTPSCDLFQTTDLYFNDTRVRFNYNNLNTFRVYITRIRAFWVDGEGNGVLWHDEVDYQPYPSGSCSSGAAQCFLDYYLRGSQVDNWPNPDAQLVPGFDLNRTGISWQIAALEANSLAMRFNRSFTSYFVYYHGRDFNIDFDFTINDAAGNVLLTCPSRALTGNYGPLVEFDPPRPIPTITGPFSIGATASDPDGTINRVRFEVYNSSGVNLGSYDDTNGEPYCFFGSSGGVCNTRTRGQNWPGGAIPIQNGTFSIYIQARDNESSRSYTRIRTTIVIDVANTPTPSPTITRTATQTPTVTPTPCPSNGTGLEGDYYNWTGGSPPSNPFAGAPALVRIDPTVNFDWGSGSPGQGVGVDQFATRWIGWVVPRFPGETVTFYTETDDGVRVWVNGTRIINYWQNQSPTIRSGSIALPTCQQYTIVMEYFENGGGAVARLGWDSPLIPGTGEIIPMQHLYPPNPGTARPTSTQAPATATYTPAPTRTASPTRTITLTPTITLSPTISLTPTRTPKPSDTPTPTVTSITPTRTRTLVPTGTLTGQPTRTPTKTNTGVVPTLTPSPTMCLTPPDLGGCP